MIEDLVEELLFARHIEQDAKNARIDAEQALLDALPKSGKLEGTTTVACDGYKITTTAKLNRKLDVEAYESLMLPSNMTFVDYKPAINLKNLRGIERIDPKLVASCVTVKPAKTTIKIVEVN